MALLLSAAFPSDSPKYFFRQNSVKHRRCSSMVVMSSTRKARTDLWHHVARPLTPCCECTSFPDPVRDLHLDRIATVAQSADRVATVARSADRVATVAQSADRVVTVTRSADCETICRLMRYLRILRLRNAICRSRKFPDRVERIHLVPFHVL